MFKSIVLQQRARRGVLSRAFYWKRDLTPIKAEYVLAVWKKSNQLRSLPDPPAQRQGQGPKFGPVSLADGRADDDDAQKALSLA